MHLMEVPWPKEAPPTNWSYVFVARIALELRPVVAGVEWTNRLYILPGKRSPYSDTCRSPIYSKTIADFGIESDPVATTRNSVSDAVAFYQFRAINGTNIWCEYI